MKKILLQLVVAVLPAVTATACSGHMDGPEDLTGSPADLRSSRPDLSATPADLSTTPNDLSGLPPDLSAAMNDLGSCMTAVYRLDNGSYPAVLGSGAIIADSCRTGVVGSQLETTRAIANDGFGNVTLTSGDGSTLYGTGPVRCNRAVLTNGPVLISDGVCRFTANYRLTLMVTADNTFEFVGTQTRTSPASEPGQTCLQPATCTVDYGVKHKK